MSKYCKKMLQHERRKNAKEKSLRRQEVMLMQSFRNGEPSCHVSMKLFLNPDTPDAKVKCRSNKEYVSPSTLRACLSL